MFQNASSVLHSKGASTSGQEGSIVRRSGSMRMAFAPYVN